MVRPKQLDLFYLFKGLTPTELNAFVRYCKPLKAEPGQLIAQEGQTPDHLFLILAGTFEVIKKDPETDQEYTLAFLHEGDTVGEMALLDQQPRSGTVRAVESGELYTISLSDLKHFDDNHREIYLKMIKNIGKETSKRLRFTNDVTLKSFIIRDKIENFLILTIITLCFYAFTLKLIPIFFANFAESIYPSLFLFISLIFPILYIIRSRHYSIAKIINVSNWQKNILQGILYTIPVLILTVLVKLFLIQMDPSLKNLPLFDGFLVTNHISWQNLLLIAVYIISCPIQEFVVRGVLQGSLQIYLQGKAVVFRSIIISNVIYATMHLYLSFTYTLIALILGLFLGGLYAKQRSLVGVVVAHILIGIWAIYILGIHKILFNV